MENVNILVVDDIKINYMVLKSMLRSTASNVLWATDHKEALEICEKYKIHLVFMDFQLPGMNGYDLSIKLRQQHAQLPVIFQTANSEAIFNFLGKRSDAELDILEKPIQRKMLLNKVQEYIH